MTGNTERSFASAVAWIIWIMALLTLAPPNLSANAGLTATETDILRKYDHDRHERLVFGPAKIDCSHCHNFSQADGKWKLEDKLKASTFRKPVGQICHECHQGAVAEFRNAPKACYTCHTSLENMKQIKPQSHSSGDWAHGHGTNARSNAESCTTCHSNSQCVKCHARRDTVLPVNHSRNFKFTHSIEARAQPQKCDTCHSKGYCIRCHMGKGR